jgi:microcystin-dependent protein
MNRKHFTKLLKVLGVLLLVSAICNLTSVHAGVPKLINFEGKLTEKDGTPITGLREIRFRIYESADSEIPIWVETRQVTIDNGFYSILLGSVNPFSSSMKFDTTYWLGVQVSGDSEMVPRYQFGAVPYAINADMVDGKDSVELIPPGVIVMWSGTIASIPSGWQLCDGTNGTPDLRDRFILGVPAGQEPGQTGGAHSRALTVTNLPPHNHSASCSTAGAHTHGVDRRGGDAGTGHDFMHRGEGYTNDMTSAGDHTHTITIGNTGSGTVFDNRPAYFTLAFIMKL